MEKNISIFFSKLSPIHEKDNYSIELTINKKTNIISYPQNAPLIIPLSQKIEKQILLINVQSKQISKKQKIIGHGEIIIYNKFLTEKPIEKYILLFKENKDKNKIKLNNNSVAKIFAQIKLDEISNIVNQTKEKDNNKENTKEKNNLVKVELNDNKQINEIDIENTFIKLDDDYMKFYNNIDEILSDKNIIKLKEKINNEENSLPNDINSLKIFNNNLFKQYKLLNDKYSKILLSLSEDTQNLNQKIKESENKNNEIEEEIIKLKSEKVIKEEEIKQKMKDIKEKDEIFSKKLESIKKQENILNNQILSKNNNDNSINKPDLNDIKDICNIIKKLDSLGYNVQEGDLTDSEKQNLYDLLNNSEKDKIVYENQILDEKKLNQIKEDYELGDKIITLIERDVNDLFSRKLIELVTIDQIDSISYIFSGKIKKKEVTFKLEENNLICSTGETFAVWLIKNFSL